MWGGVILDVMMWLMVGWGGVRYGWLGRDGVV